MQTAERKASRLPGGIETSVKVQVMRDDDADMSYLEQEGFEKRLAAYEAGDFTCYGICVKVIVHNWTTGSTQTFESSGLWGIESDASSQYFYEVAGEEMAKLKAEYPQLANCPEVTTKELEFIEY
jgi:hypothetical protein